MMAHVYVFNCVIGLSEIRCTPPKEDKGILNCLSHKFFIGNSQKVRHFFVCKGKEDMGIPKIFDHV